MSPQAFIAHWQGKSITERQGAQSHFIDLCDMLSVERPRDPNNYCFERGAKTSDGQGWADVWKRGCFAWEYKAPGKDLKAALKQLMNYALALDNPPLLVVSDLSIIEIHTHFTGYASTVHIIRLDEIDTPENQRMLRALFDNPDFFRPDKTTFHVTEQAAARMGELAKRLTDRGNDPHLVAHFLIQCVFCMFAEDAGLLPEKLFETVMDKSNPDGGKAQKRLTALFEAMCDGGGFGADDIPWFNGGLFKNIVVPELQTVDVIDLLDAARMNWGNIEPAILGTLFERGLNPDMRSQLGAHYTDPATIMKLIRPVVEAPLLAEWEPVKAAIAERMKKYEAGGKGSQIAYNDARALLIGFLDRLKSYRVLDPACGSGNFLYLSLKSLKDIEHKARLEAETLGLQRELDIGVSPANVMGIELNPYAAELARITVWIGEIQWMIGHGYRCRENPILSSLDHIENRDAIIGELILGTDITVHDKAGNIVGTEGRVVMGVEAEWPAVDAIVGNPPFLGGSKKRGELGDEYFRALSAVFNGSVPDGADLVCYWFEKARKHIEQGKARAAGLVTTQAIRAGTNRKVLARIIESGSIFEAWSDEPWVNAGAAVRVSLICFSSKMDSGILDGRPVTAIYADLTARSGLDLTKAKSLKENVSTSFEGTKKYGDFDIPGELARQWLKLPNPNGRPNSDVVKPWANGRNITGRTTDTWIIDFGTDLPENDAALYEAPFSYVQQHVKPFRTDAKWWLHERSRPEMRKAMHGLNHFIATPRVAKHRYFVLLPITLLPDTRLNVIARDDDATFGILSSRLHEIWSLANASMHGVGNDPTYNAKSCFETFPFPTGLTPADNRGSTPHGDAISAAACNLDQQRKNWLNPPEWVEWVRTQEEEAAGYPARPVAKPGFEADLKKRTLTNLYNARPSWLDNAHKVLDAAVAAAYGWTDYTPDMPDDVILRRLLKLNLERSDNG